MVVKQAPLAIAARAESKAKAERDAKAAADAKVAADAKAWGFDTLTPINADWIDPNHTPDPMRFVAVGKANGETLCAIPFGKVSLLAAKGGTGKTTLSAQLAIAVATGGDWIGFGVAEPGRVLWLLGEEDDAIAKRLVWHAANAAKLNEGKRAKLLANLHVMTFAGKGTPLALREKRDDKPSEFAMRVAEAFKNGASDADPWRLVIVDPLSRFSHAEDENDNAAATKVIEGLETLAKASGAAVLACHHSGKGEKTNGDAFRGASALLDGARFGMTLAWPTAEEETNERTLRCVKSNYGAKWKASLTFDVRGKVFVLGSAGASATNAKNNRAKPAQPEEIDVG